MKKVERIEINKKTFLVDEEAFVKLQRFMQKTEKKYNKKGQESEYVQIEAQIAEFFEERLGPHKEILNISDVEQLMIRFGEKEEVNEKESDHSSGNSIDPGAQSSRLFRDLEKAQIAGICSGIGYYFGIDPLWIRIGFLFAILLNGLGVLAYIILWIAVPPARTEEDFREMKRGSKRTSENIKYEYDRVRGQVKNFSNSKEYENMKSGIRQFFELIGYLFAGLVKIIVVLLALGFVFLGMAIIFGIPGFFIFRDIDFFFSDLFFEWNIPHYLSLNHLNGDELFLAFAAFFVLVIPIIAVIYWIIKKVFNMQTKNKGWGIGLFALWILSLITIISLTPAVVKNIFEFREESSSFTLKEMPGSALHIDLTAKNMEYRYKESFIFPFREYGYIYTDGEKMLYGSPELFIEKQSTEEISLTIKKKYADHEEWDYSRNQNEISYSWLQDDSLLLLDRYFLLKDATIWDMPEVEIHLKVPYDIDIVPSYYAEELIGYSDDPF